MRSEGMIVGGRLRIARNYESDAFPLSMTESASFELVQRLRHRLSGREGVSFFEMTKLDPLTRYHLLAREKLSSLMLTGGIARAVALSEDDQVSLLINEEDHLRLQLYDRAADFRTLYERAGEWLSDLQGIGDFAFRNPFGYLTSSPMNVGTGLKLSVRLHLPALDQTGEIERVKNAVHQVGFLLSDPLGAPYYQLSTRQSIGRTEEEIISVIERVIENLAERESQEKERLWSLETADRVYRAYGVLSYARKIGPAEYLHALSDLRWGILAGRVGTVDQLEGVDDALAFLKKGALNYLAGRVLTAPEQAELRATYAREMMTGIEVKP